MKILKEIKSMYQLLPKNEQECFIKVFSKLEELNKFNHTKKQIIYNILLWRTR